MVDLRDKAACPTLEDFVACVRCEALETFCRTISERYGVSARLEFSGCSMEYGWNVKFKKSGRSLCTIYPRENYFCALIVVGRSEKEAVEALLPDCCPEIRAIYEQTAEGNGQRWLMIDLEDEDAVYRDALRLIEIRSRKG